MGRCWSSLGVVLVGVFGWVHTAQAARVIPPGEPMAWVIESADYTGEVKDQIVRMEARYTIRTIHDGWTEIPLALQGASITGIEVKRKSGEAHLMPRGHSYALITNRKGTYEVHVKFSTRLSQESQVEGLQLGIPQATFSTMKLFVPRKDVELRPADQLYVERMPDGGRGGVQLIARLGAAERIDLGWSTRPTMPVNVEPVLYGEVHTVVTLEEQLVHLTSIIEYRVTQGEVKELRLTVPSSLNILNIRGAGIEDWTIMESKELKTLTVELGLPLKEATYRLVLEGEALMGSASASYPLPEVVLEGVKQERGYLAVGRTGNIEVASDEATGLTRIDVRELPAPFATSVSTPAVLAFRYHQHPYHVMLRVTRHQDHPVLAAIAERADLATVFSRQGELLTRAAYLIKANKKQFLEVVMPEGAILWSCIVGGASVKPVEGGDGTLLVPLATSQDPSQAVPVEIVYFERRPIFTGIGSVRLSGPRLDIPTTVANWSLYAPSELKFLRMSGNLERGAATVTFLDEPFMRLPEAVAAEHRPGALEAFASRTSFSTVNREGQRAFALSKLSADRRQVQEALKEGGSEEGPDQRLPEGLPATASASGFDDAMHAFAGRLKETGILPLKIQLPKAGTVYRFNRLMTTGDPLRWEATFVHLRMPWAPFAAVGLLLIPIGGVAVGLARRR